ncbi:MAG: hypothetical protein PQJ58_15420 [Spirochaetales bacterium]|nr:hypothetical protein [Spirochaetales bacterium]
MHREDSERHTEILDFMLPLLKSGDTFGYSTLALNGFMRIVSHKKIFREPSDFETMMKFVESITSHPASRCIDPGPAHWQLYRHLCYEHKPSGNLYPDVYFAALAMESECTWVSCDSDFKQFRGLDSLIL